MPDKFMTAFPYVDAVERALYSQTVSGVENIPTEGNGIIAANHLRAADSLLLPAIIARELGRKTIFAAKTSYFQGGFEVFGKEFRSPTRWFFEEYTEAIPVDREDPRAFEKLNKAAIEKLNEGNLFAIHFEGSRSIDGRLYKPRAGMARIALNSGAPIIPTAITYPTPAWYNVRQPATVDFLEPITASEYGDLKPFEIGELVRERVQAVTGQELADEYARVLSKQERKELLKQLRRSGRYE
jgi:1-acyl-sn-glycerol-3-phosphate acyltransferase